MPFSNAKYVLNYFYLLYVLHNWVYFPSIKDIIVLLQNTITVSYHNFLKSIMVTEHLLILASFGGDLVTGVVSAANIFIL